MCRGAARMQHVVGATHHTHLLVLIAQHTHRHKLTLTQTLYTGVGRLKKTSSLDVFVHISSSPG